MSRIDEVPWTTQPQESVHPSDAWVNKGLIFAYSGASRRLEYGLRGMQAGPATTAFSTNTHVPGVSERGQGAIFNGSNSAQGWAANSTLRPSLTAQPFTFVIVARADSTASEIRALGFGVSASALFHIETNGTTWRFQVRDDSAAFATNLLGPSVVSKQTEVVVARIAADRSMSLFMRGTKYTAAGPAGNITPVSISLGHLDRFSDGVAIQCWNGWLGDAFVFDGALSDDDCQSIQANPFQIWDSAYTFVPAAAAGGATSGVGASAGAGAASATSQATWAAVGASVGAGTGAATSQATWAAVGASAGAGGASATGTDANGGISSATAASSGAGAASATSQATWATVGASAGTGAGAATSQTVAASIGASAGVGAAAATGDDANSAFSSATAASSGTGAAAATSRATWATVAASVATSSVAATANAVWAGVGASTGTATASADGATSSAVQAAAGTATASSTAGAVAQVVVAAVGAIAAVAVAGGVSNAISAVVEVVGAAVAVAVASAVTQAIWNAVGASTGAAAAAGASPVTLDAAAVARQIVVRTMEAVVVVTSRGLASKVVTDG